MFCRAFCRFRAASWAPFRASSMPVKLFLSKVLLGAASHSIGVLSLIEGDYLACTFPVSSKEAIHPSTSSCLRFRERQRLPRTTQSHTRALLVDCDCGDRAYSRHQLRLAHPSVTIAAVAAPDQLCPAVLTDNRKGYACGGSSICTPRASTDFCFVGPLVNLTFNNILAIRAALSAHQLCPSRHGFGLRVQHMA